MGLKLWSSFCEQNVEEMKKRAEMWWTKWVLDLKEIVSARPDSRLLVLDVRRIKQMEKGSRGGLKRGFARFKKKFLKRRSFGAVKVMD